MDLRQSKKTAADFAKHLYTFHVVIITESYGIYPVLEAALKVNIRRFDEINNHQRKEGCDRQQDLV